MSEIISTKKPSLLGIITQPLNQFERIKIHPRFWGALICITFLFMIGSWLNTLNLKVELLGNFTEEEKIWFKQLMTIGSIIRGFFSPIFSVLISSSILLIIARITQSEVSFRQLFSMNIYVKMIPAAGLMFNAIIALLIDGNSEPTLTSLGAIMSNEGTIGSLFSEIEIFKIWSVVITAFGLQKVADFSKGLAWSISIIFFFVGLILTMLMARINGMVGV